MQITTFIDEGEDSTLIAPEVNTSVAIPLLHDSTMEDRKHEIRDFLGRPYVIDQFDWVTTDTVGVLKTYRFPDVLLTFAAIIAKIRGFYGFRAGVELKVLVNKQPFQAGNLMISYLPAAKYNGYKWATHNTSVTSRSGAPRVNLDLMDATSATLEVPFASPHVYYNLLTQEGTIGDFTISVYSQLSDVASTGKVPVTVFARFIDVDLQFPTGAPPTFQGPNAKLFKAVERLGAKVDVRTIAKLQKELSAAKATLTAQMGEETVTSAFKQKALPNMTNTNESNVSHVMAVSSNNSLVPSNTGSTSSDDMDFTNILSIPCYHDRVSWTATSSTTAALWSKVVTPQIAAETFSNSSLGVDYLYFISELFNLWRGSIIYSFRVVKTPYHSGRLRVFFSPGSTSLVDVDRNSCINKVVDLKESNEFEFEVPYIHPYPWLATKSGTTSVGIIAIDVLNALVAPATVSSSVEIIVERRGGRDMEFNLPVATTKVPLDPTVPTMRAQMGAEVIPSQDQARKGMDPPTHVQPFYTLDASRQTVGTTVRHVGDLVKRSTLFQQVTTTATQVVNNSTLVNAVAPTVADPFPVGATLTGIGAVQSGTNAFLVQPGDYIVDLYYQGTGLTGTTIPTVTSGTITEYSSVASATELAYSYRLTTDVVTTMTLQPVLGTTVSVASMRLQMYSPLTVAATFPLHYNPHFMGVASLDANENATYTSSDNLSYFSSLYAFFRGGINTRMSLEGDSFTVIMDPSNSINSQDKTTGVTSGTAFTNLDNLKLSNTMSQVIVPNVEGMGEFTTPFYANTFCSYVAPQASVDLSDAVSNFQLPQTNLIVNPKTSLGPNAFSVFRAATSDFQFSYLTGPPILYPFTS